MRSDSLTNLLFIVLFVFLMCPAAAFAQTKVQGNASITVVSASNYAAISDADVAAPDSGQEMVTGTDTTLVRTAVIDPDTGVDTTEITLMY